MRWAVTGLYTLTLFVAAALLFSAQPMVARSILPALGGSPAVWTTCMLFFQAELLAAYAYAHFVTVRLAPRSQVGLQLVLLLAAGSLLANILSPDSSTPFGKTDATARLLMYLMRSVGLPVFGIATTAPLLQRWYSQTRSSRDGETYFLYAASNAGSLLALLAYPFWIERTFGLARQNVLWNRGFVVLAVLVGVSGITTLLLNSRKDTEHREVRARIPPLTWLSWVTLAFIPSSFLLGVTSYLTTDLAAIPLLWVIPLTLYLLSFIIVFGRAREAVGPFWPRVFPFLVILLAGAIGIPLVEPFWLIVPLHLVVFFGAAMICHGLLAANRPTAEGFTSFYLAIALGGALGGLFNAVVAPHLFDQIAEYPIALVATCLVVAFQSEGGIRGRFTRGDVIIPGVVGILTSALCANPGGFSDGAFGAIATTLAAGFSVLVVASHRKRPFRFALTIGALLIASSFAVGVRGRVLFRERSFFGVLIVTNVAKGEFHRLFHGSTLHGEQCIAPDRRREPLTYFTNSGPIGQVLEAFKTRPGSDLAHVAVTGVGAGALASYAQEGQEWSFYEIDPAVIRVARDPKFFTYLNDSRASKLDFFLGDARIELTRAADASFDLMILDAFSSDAIPAHLLTRESLALYRRKLKPSGWLVFNISNRYLDLAPVVSSLAADAGWVCRVRVDADVSPEQRLAGKQGSIWALVVERENDLGTLATDRRWKTHDTDPRDTVWTDDFSNIVQHLRFQWPRLPGQSRTMRESK